MSHEALARPLYTLELSKRNELQRMMRSPAECLLDCDWSLAGSVALVTGGSGRVHGPPVASVREVKGFKLCRESLRWNEER